MFRIMEIKFRVPHFDIGTKKFKCFYYWGRIDYKGSSSKNNFVSPASTSSTYAGDDQQFTGLKDKNNKEIYEGDLFQVAGNKIYQIRYSEGGESNYEWHGGVFVLWVNEETFFPFDEFAMKNGKVIGNIYENKSLLENVLNHE
jgi:uncharacterized phage protein (TIGR01671 family)